ncbi:DinB family protein [Halalkalibacillus halophilus]|uniref:DinB family protein n=1 Tax=Halalkalibacillus halophilus TaxID=392827 RepID=UPI0003FB6207|nr:DinB family protein [Halalkalibacillus halophilus]
MNETQLFDQAKLWRSWLVGFLKNLPDEQLDVIPEGFNNNIRWNAGHVLVTWDKMMTSVLNEDSFLVSLYKDSFARGTSPKDWTSNPPLKEDLIEQLERQLDQIEKLSSSRLNQEIPFEMFHMKEVGEVCQFLISHEAMHLSVMNSQKKMLEL